MKKILLSLLMVILFTGCEATYELELSDGKFEDQTKIYDKREKTLEAVESDSGQKQIIDTLYQFERYIPKIADNHFFSTETIAGYKYSHSFELGKDLDNWPSLVGQCYSYVDVYQKENRLIFKTPAQFLCFDTYKELTKATLHFTVHYDVISHNADSVDGNVYTWTMTRGNNIKPIYLEIDYEKEKEVESEKKSFPIGWLLGTLFLIGIGILSYFTYKKRKENNNF